MESLISLKKAALASSSIGKTEVNGSFELAGVLITFPNAIPPAIPSITTITARMGLRRSATAPAKPGL